ncbi:hypothetical protein J6590_045062 [Homalodisca vitripennis]|nr:hypothetical protein J6590_045062 [Homalodisca vitripennis]
MPPESKSQVTFLYGSTTLMPWDALRCRFQMMPRSSKTYLGELRAGQRLTSYCQGKSSQNGSNRNQQSLNIAKSEAKRTQI